MGLTRREALMSTGAGIMGAAVGAGAGYYGHDLLRGAREAVPGFLWSDDEFPYFRDDELLRTAPAFEGDPSIGFQHPKDSPTVAIIGTVAARAMRELAAHPDARLGLIYTDPGDTWHQGMGKPRQVYGGIVQKGGEAFLAVALGIGKGDVQMSWAVRSDGLTVPLPSIAVETQAIPRESLGSQFPGVAAL